MMYFVSMDNGSGSSLYLRSDFFSNTFGMDSCDLNSTKRDP